MSSWPWGRWDNDVILDSNYVMLCKQPPSWIRHLGFLGFSKVSEKHKNGSKVIKISNTVLIGLTKANLNRKNFKNMPLMIQLP